MKNNNNKKQIDKETRDSIDQAKKRIKFELERHGENAETIQRMFDTYFEDLPELVQLHEQFQALLMVKPEFCETHEEYCDKICNLRKHLNYRRWVLRQNNYNSPGNIIKLMKDTNMPAKANIMALTDYVTKNLNNVHDDFVKGLQFALKGVV